VGFYIAIIDFVVCGVNYDAADNTVLKQLCCWIIGGYVASQGLSWLESPKEVGLLYSHYLISNSIFSVANV
jgi:hypothetical protein